MGRTTRLYHASLAALFLALGGCGQKEVEPVAETPVAVEEQVPREVEPRNVSPPKRQEFPVLEKKILVEKKETPARAEAPTVAGPTVVPTVAPVVIPETERKQVLVQQNRSSAQLMRGQPQESFSEIELGAIAWTQGDFTVAFDWFYKAAEVGNSEAQFYVGMMYANGEGVAQDYDAALEWFEKAVEQRNLTGEQVAALSEMVEEIQRAALEAARLAEINSSVQATLIASAVQPTSGNYQRYRSSSSLPRMGMEAVSARSSVVLQALKKEMITRPPPVSPSSP